MAADKSSLTLGSALLLQSLLPLRPASKLTLEQSSELFLTTNLSALFLPLFLPPLGEAAREQSALHFGAEPFFH